MRYVKSNAQQTEWFVMLVRKGVEHVISRHSNYFSAVQACWPKY